MTDKRNASVVRGDGETLESYTGRINELISRIEWQSEGHRQWYTHKNPYGCWICEILQIGRNLYDELVAKPDTRGIREGELEEPSDGEIDTLAIYDNVDGDL